MASSAMFFLCSADGTMFFLCGDRIESPSIVWRVKVSVMTIFSYHFLVGVKLGVSKSQELFECY